MCKTWPGSFPEKKDLEEGFHFQPTKNSICIQVLQGFSLNSWITAGFRCQDTEMGQRHREMTCSQLEDSEVRALNISSLVFNQATPDVLGSHSTTLFPTATKGAGWFPRKETDYNVFWIIRGERSFPSLGWRMGFTCSKAQSKDHPLGSRRCEEKWCSMVPLHDGCKSSEAVLFPCTQRNCTTVPSKAAQAKNQFLVSSRRQLSFGLFLIFCCLNGLQKAQFSCDKSVVLSPPS